MCFLALGGGRSVVGGFEQEARVWHFVDCYRPARPFATSSCRPQQNAETVLYQATSAISCNSRGSFFYTTPFCFETSFTFENVSFVVECPTEPSSPLSLCCPAVLQLKLQQRRTREELVSQGIMPRKYHALLQRMIDLLFGHGCMWPVFRRRHPTESRGDECYLSLLLWFSMFRGT